MSEKLRVDRPSKAAIGRIAENQPGLLNLLVAYFVFEWRSVRLMSSTGIDQNGEKRRIPDFVSMWTHDGRDGVDVCVHYLLAAPAARGLDEPGYLSAWLKSVAGSADKGV